MHLLSNIPYGNYALCIMHEELYQMVTAYVLILILWTGIWHRFLKQEIRYPHLSALRDMLPFLLTAAAAMVITHFLTLWLLPYLLGHTTPSAWVELVVRILLAALLYLGTLWLLRAKILRESIGYLTSRKSSCHP